MKPALLAYTRIDYGNGVRRYFSREQIRYLRRLLGLARGAGPIREATREWAVSMPTMKVELGFTCR